MADQDESSVASVCEFTGLDPVVYRELVVSALREKAGDVEAVVAAFYDDEVKFRQMFTWNEAHFVSDRDGTSNDTGLPKFNVQGPDDVSIIHGVSPTGHHLGAPSRPPSRTQSPLGRMVDWTTQANRISTYNSQAEEDTELQRALAASVSSLHPPQESGWAMVRATPDNKELGPSSRRRAPGTPAILRCRKEGSDTYNLNALLTILHSVPGVRNTFLRSGQPARNYGQDPDWWKGSLSFSIGESSQEGALSTAEESVSRIATTHDRARNFTEEIHRIMAFLDGTDRVYGSADIFSNAKLLGELWDDKPDRLFFNFFKEVNPPEISETLFSDIGLVGAADEDDCTYIESYAILDAKIERGQYFGELRDIYNILDTIYWVDLGGVSMEPIATAKMAVSTRLGMIQIFNICVDGLEQPVEIPEVFFPDRYTAENRQLALQLQLKLRSVGQAFKESDDMCNKIATFTDKSSNFTLSQATLSEQAIGLGMQKLWQLKAAAFWKQHEVSVGTPEEFDFSLADVDVTELTAPEDLRVEKAIQAEVAVHRKKLTDIGNKLQKLREEKEACEELLRQLRLRNTGPATADDWNPTHRYRLRGIIVSSGTFYMCRLKADTDDEVLMNGADQWWRISSSASVSEPVRIEKTSIEMAQQAAFRDNNRPIVVYANDAAINETLEPLSDSLRTFVRFDNRFFKQELVGEGPREKKRMPTEPPTSPSKRQQRSNSIDSMATNKASVDELSDRDMSDVLLVAGRFVVSEGFDDVLVEKDGEGYGDSTANGTPQDVQRTDKEGCLGTEMVQLAISRPGAQTPAGVAGMDGNETRLGTENDGVNGKEDGADDKCNTSLRQRQSNENMAHDKVSLLADWEYPEGRYVGPPDGTKEP
ncbi:ubiquitin interaction motif protein [Grosmannia clavigera kw1407]|uniref:Ubiquitin interaction motif protein n=1 Tax=Grosmannia clavigera (strain kw1407 / UAMH 11150) TaxID=655863 RepID=F0XRU8_GROCL|nr:ubiquitin interaction motif protein [Grosmannia clavigera kw1407]EFW99550.1 ubiquitin interaction motif protein [Grosmannia clavigera kw1407]